MKGKIRSRIASALVLSLVIGMMPGASADAKGASKDMKEAESIRLAGEQPVADGEYRILTALDTSRGMDVATDSELKDGSNIQLHTITFKDCEFFKFEYQGNGYYEISIPGTDKRIDHRGQEKRDGANCNLWTDNDSDAQRFRLEDAGDGYYYIRSKVDGRCLDVERLRTANGTNIIMWSKNGGKNQKWKLEAETKPVADGQYRIMTAMDESYGFDRAGNNVTAGTNIQLFKISANDVPLFNVEYDKKGFYKIGVPNTSQVLDHAGASQVNGANLQIYDDHGGANQRWRFEDAGDGYFYIRSGVDGRFIDVKAVVCANRQNIYLWDYNGGLKNQKWKLLEEPEPKLENLSLFSMAGGIRVRWAMESDPNNRGYKIDKTFDTSYSKSQQATLSLFSSVSATPDGLEVQYRENEDDTEWESKEIPVDATGTYAEILDLSPGIEYLIKLRPYYLTRFLGVPIPGLKHYKQPMSKVLKRTTMDSNESDIKFGDNTHNSIAKTAQKYGWYSGMHTQYFTGTENCLYDMVCKNKDFQIWIGYKNVKNKTVYSWKVYDYKLNQYKVILKGKLKDLKKDLAVYAAGSSKPRLSTEYLKYKKGQEYTIKLVNTGKAAKWSLPEHSNARVRYGGVDIVRNTASTITVRFTKLKGEHYVYPYIEAKIGDDIYRCYIESEKDIEW